MIEIKRPTTSANPDFITGNPARPYKFNCQICNAPTQIDFDRQINNSWNGRTEKITEEEVKELKSFYGIGLSGKSHDGGLPVFDKVFCEKCRTSYLTYCGVIETSNSAYSVTINGIIRK
jgi:hypothetical protein